MAVVCAANSPISISALDRHAIGGVDHHAFQRPRQDDTRRCRHCSTHCTISAFSSMRAMASARSFGSSADTSFRLALRLRSSSTTFAAVA